MIQATELQYETRRRLNRFNTDFEKKLTIPALDSILTEAVQIVIQQSALLYEVRDDIAANLDSIVLRDVKLKKIDGKEKDKVKLPNDFYKLLKIICTAQVDECPIKKLIVRPFQTQKVEEALISPYWDPSYKWGETIGIKANATDYFVYHNDSFHIDSVYIDYMTLHPNIATPSLMEEGRYRNANGEVIVDDQGLLLDNAYQLRMVCDIATVIATRDLGDGEQYQTQINKILFNNNLYFNNQQK